MYMSHIMSVGLHISWSWSVSTNVDCRSSRALARAGTGPRSLDRPQPPPPPPPRGQIYTIYTPARVSTYLTERLSAAMAHTDYEIHDTPSPLLPAAVAALQEVPSPAAQVLVSNR